MLSIPHITSPFAVMCYRLLCKVYWDCSDSRSHQQRMFFQRNAEQLHMLNMKHFAAKAGCGHPFYHVDPNGHDAYWQTYKGKLPK